MKWEQSPIDYHLLQIAKEDRPEDVELVDVYCNYCSLRRTVSQIGLIDLPEECPECGSVDYFVRQR